MFCYQCEQTAKGTGCNIAGVCGKTPEVADLQDLLIEAAKGVSMYAHRARGMGVCDRDVDHFVVEALFTTVTNVNFDALRMAEEIVRASRIRERAKVLYEDACRKAGKTPEVLGGAAAIPLPADKAEMVVAGGLYSPDKNAQKRGEVAQGLYDLVLLGLKGSAAYAHHAFVLGQEDDEIYGFFHEKLDALTQEGLSVDDLVGHAMDAGKWNITIMALLDRANTETYGHPEPTPVRITHLKGKAILVSGHDLRDLELLLRQTEGRGINVYTHGEMLPCHGYPQLKKYRHLAGNYGGAWQDQQKEFAAFPGAILMTTNCIQKPVGYTDRIFTTGLVAFPGVRHIDDRKDFSPVIEAALAAPGFDADGEDKKILVGFGRNAVLNAAGTVVDLVKRGRIRHFFLVGGCDGAKSGRNYYTDFATQAPKDTVILTLACGKFRFNKLDFGDIEGLPRLLDVGQCNDAYSAVRIAMALAEAFGTDVNGLPLSLVLSWYEQKAVCILLSLLHLGIRNMRIGPSLPAFLKPPVIEFLQKNFNLQPITTAEADLKAILG